MVTPCRLVCSQVTYLLFVEARSLLTNILQTDPTKRLTIAQILAHPWFIHHSGSPSSLDNGAISTSPASPPVSAPFILAAQPVSTSSDASDVTYHSASSEISPSTPPTPEEAAVSVIQDDDAALSRIASDSTLRHSVIPQLEKISAMNNVQEDAADVGAVAEETLRPSLSRTTTASHVSTSSKGPPALPTRTPVRTKRRSVSSTLSEPGSPTMEKPSASPTPPQDFSSMLSTPAPLIFSTPLERELLNSLSHIGFDTGQIVHSVLADACDATGALWWMLKRKTERRALQEVAAKSFEDIKEEVYLPKIESVRHNDEKESKGSKGRSLGSRSERSRSPIPPALLQSHSAPEVQLIPATPTGPSHRPATPPRAMSPSNPLLSPGNSTPVDSTRSHPSTPSGSMKEKEGSKGRGKRSGSVSIMQRAATALEAAGLVRKRSAEAVKEGRESDEKRSGSGDDPRLSHASSSKLLRSPPLKPLKDEPGTPPRSSDLNTASVAMGSPWVLTHTRGSPPPTPANSPGNSLGTLSTIGENTVKIGNNRNRASLLTTFRMWFKEDAKGKRKEPPPPLAPQSLAYPSSLASAGTSPATGRRTGSVKRGMNSGRSTKVTGRKTANRAKRGSVSSRRSSSVNSKRSSVTSAQIGTFEPSSYGEQMVSVSRQRSDPSRRSFGSHTPNSESRPSSVHSFTMQPRHRKSPSASSSGSMYMGRTSSPLPKYHKRGSSGSSTRVVRQIPTSVSTYKQSHLRSNSASSNHSLTSSRHNSLYDLSESENIARTSSPTTNIFSREAPDDTPRRAGPTTFVAQKRQTPFANPGGGGYLYSIGRSSWKKSWGLEPPGWQTRTAKASTIEVLAISPAPGGIRDVFTGRQSLSMGDESDWVDEDDDVSGYVGGLGQMPASSSTGLGFAQPESPMISPPMRTPASRGSSGSKRTGGGGNGSSVPAARNNRRAGRSPAGRNSPLPNETAFDAPPETRGGRRQLPNSRSGPAFKQAIQEEDEDEE